MTLSLQWITTLTSRVLPRDMDPDEDQGRPRTVALLVSLFFTVLVVFGVIELLIGAKSKVLMSILFTGLPFPALFLMLRLGKVRLAAWTLCLFFAFSLSGAAWRMNGIWVLTTSWALLLPVVATYLMGLRAGLIFAGGWIVQLVVYLVMNRPDLPSQPRQVAMSAMMMLPLGVMMVTLFDRQQARARARLQAALSERERSEAARKISETSLRQMIENAPDLIIVHRAGRLVYTNRRLTQGLGYSNSAELVGKELASMIHPEEVAIAQARVERYDQGLENPPREFRLLRADGSVLYAEFNSFLAPYEGVQAVIAIGRDVTERRALDARLAMADRMASVGTLAAGVAHELNNPLAFVLANLTFVRTDMERSPEEQLASLRGEWAVALQEAEGGARRMRTIIQDLKTFSRSSGDDVSTLQVGEIIRSTVRMAENEIRHRASLDLQLPDDPQVQASEGRLGQVLLNLLMNAVQALPMGDAQHHRIGVRSSVEEGWARIAISDTGCGIPSEHMARIFDPFFTTKPIGEGTGLGLFICHNLVKAMGGQLQVQSEVGKGTTVSVLLPLASPASPGSETESTQMEKAGEPTQEGEPAQMMKKAGEPTQEGEPAQMEEEGALDQEDPGQSVEAVESAQAEKEATAGSASARSPSAGARWSGPRRPAARAG